MHMATRITRKEWAMAIGLVLAGTSLFGAVGWGWAMNLQKILNGSCGANYGCVAVRVIGVPVVPLGAVVGYLQ